jgi:hypothetical protein
MKFLSIAAALVLSVGLSGCMGSMHDAHHDAMMGSMMGQHGRTECPNAEPAAHEAPSTGQTSHEHAGQETPPPCPPVEPNQHQHNQPQN